MLIEVPPRKAIARLAVSLIVFALVVAGVPVLEVVSGFRFLPRETNPSRSDVMTGVAARRIEEALSARSKVAEMLRPFYTEFLWRVFKSTTAKVVPGHDGWLFLDEEIKTPPDAAASITIHADLIARLSAWWNRQGSRLLVVPIPNKSTVYPGKVGRATRATSGYGDFVRALADRSVWHVDTRAALDPSRGATFLRNDTHWSSFGAASVATAVALAARAGVEDLPGDVIDGTIVHVRTDPHRGDLQRMLGFREGSSVDDALLVEEQRFAGVRAGTREKASSNSDGPIVLCGTSFSHSFQFAALLGAEMDRVVTDRSVPGQGPTVEILRLARRVRAGECLAPKLIVWEFPEKHLFFRAKDFRIPLAAFVDDAATEAQFDGATATRLVYRDRKLSAIAPIDSTSPSLVARATSSDPFVVYEFRDPIAGDGSCALSFVVKSEHPSVAKVYVDRGNGFTESDARATPLSAGVPCRVTLVLAAPAPIKRIRIDPINVQGPFELSAPELWSRAR